MHHFRWPAAGLALCAVGICQAPPGYYSSVDLTTPATLRATLHAVIDDHTEYRYTSSSTDTWDILEDAMQDPSNPSRIVDIYRNTSYQKRGGGNSDYNREHSWPKSYGFPDAVSYGPYTDCHQLFLCHDSYNSARSNKPYGDCNSSHTEYTTQFTNGVGGGSGPFPGNSNWSAGSFTNGTWQVWSHRKGDIARAQFYLDVRYEGGRHGGTNRTEPNLILTDSRSLIASSNTGQNEPVGYMGLLSVLLQWHLDDPPTAEEIARNDVVFAYQGNRNPFVDHPEWVAMLWGLPIPGSVSQYGSGCRASGGLPQIAVPGQPLIGQSLDVQLGFAPANEFAVLHLGLNPAAIDLGVLGFGGCTMLSQPTVPVFTTTSLAGGAQVSFPVTNHLVLIGLHLYGQWLVVDTPFASLATTGGVDIVFGQ